MDLGEIQELIDTTPEELPEDNLVELSAFEPVPDNEEEDVEVAPENILTLDSLAEGFQLFFYDTGSETKANSKRRISTI